MVLPDREVRFRLSPYRLYYFDVTDRESSVLLLNTVSENRKWFTLREYEGALEAQLAMHLLGVPSKRDFENMLRSDMIVNCPVTFDDVKDDKLIFGLDVTSLKEKSVMRKPARVVKDYVEIPREILESRKDLEVSTDIMFVNKFPFLARISLGMKFTTIEYLSGKKEIALVTYITKIVSY